MLIRVSHGEYVCLIKLRCDLEVKIDFYLRGRYEFDDNSGMFFISLYKDQHYSLKHVIE